MDNAPEISVIMGVYNGEEYLRECLDSVCNQTFKDWELIVIDDCSTDNTHSILKEYASADKRIKIYKNDVNLKLATSLNRALSHSKGKYICRMDADDICLSDRFEKQYQFMEEHPDISLSSCRYFTLNNGVYSSGGGGCRYDPAFIKARLLTTNPILHPGVIAKAEVMKKLKYDPEYTCTEDLELWIRFIKAGYKIQIQPEYLIIYRLHDKQITQKSLEIQCKEVTKIHEDYFCYFLEPMNKEQAEYCVQGVYFRFNMDVKKFCKFYKWLRKVNNKKKTFERHAIDYSMFEILAEYKRCGVTDKDIIKVLLNIHIPFYIDEIPERKKRARADGLRCIAAAEKIGLKHTSGPVEFPAFTKVE